MAMGMTSTSTQVTIGGAVSATPSVVVVGSNQTDISQFDNTSRAYVADTESATILTKTVTAGKTGYITDFCICYGKLTSTGGYMMTARIYVDGVLKSLIRIRIGATNEHAFYGQHQNFSTPLVVPAGKAVTVTLTTSWSGTDQWFCSFQGVEQ